MKRTLTLLATVLMLPTGAFAGSLDAAADDKQVLVPVPAPATSSANLGGLGVAGAAGLALVLAAALASGSSNGTTGTNGTNGTN